MTGKGRPSFYIPNKTERISFMKKQKRKWEQAVDYSCVHALHAAGYDKPDSFIKVNVSDLILVPEVDANDVASLLAFFYGERNKWRSQVGRMPNFNISKAELAQDIQDICEYYAFDTYPDTLMNISVAEFLELDGIDEVTIPPMVRKIKHLMCDAGTFDIPPISKCQYIKADIVGDEEPGELTWAEQDKLLDEPDDECEYDDNMGEFQPPEYTGGLVHAW